MTELKLHMCLWVTDDLILRLRSSGFEVNQLEWQSVGSIIAWFAVEAKSVGSCRKQPLSHTQVN